MSWRVVMVSSNAKLDYKLDYLVVRTVDEVKRIHISEIGVLVVESTAISLTAYLLCELIQHKVKVIFCDHNRDPLAELIPTCGSHDSSARIHRQINWPKAVCEQVWTEILREKLRRQRDHLQSLGLVQANLLTQYLEQLQWNDVTNREAHAAKVYFNGLFGKEFSRTADTPLNAALNYGYSLLLSAINREISAAGYLNQLGIAHENTFNPFNLGCDFIEPLRPLVDSAVLKMQPQEFGRDEKIALLGLLNKQVRYDSKRQYLLYAVRLYCAGLFRALESGDISQIKWIDYEW